MYYTHHFAHHETLTRARSWLAQLGFTPDQIEVHTDGIPRLSLAIEAQRLDQVQFLLHAVERTDPEGWPAFWDIAHQALVYPGAPEPPVIPEPYRARSAPIGWHPLDREQLSLGGRQELPAQA